MEINYSTIIFVLESEKKIKLLMRIKVEGKPMRLLKR